MTILSAASVFASNENKGPDDCFKDFEACYMKGFMAVDISLAMQAISEQYSHCLEKGLFSEVRDLDNKELARYVMDEAEKYIQGQSTWGFPLKNLKLESFTAFLTYRSLLENNCLSPSAMAKKLNKN